MQALKSERLAEARNKALNEGVAYKDKRMAFCGKWSVLHNYYTGWINCFCGWHLPGQLYAFERSNENKTTWTAKQLKLPIQRKNMG